MYDARSQIVVLILRKYYLFHFSDFQISSVENITV